MARLFGVARLRLFKQKARIRAGLFVFAFAFLLVSTLGLQGCATPQFDALHTQFPAALPRHIELDKVPYFAQEAHQCGPATLAMAFGAAGVLVEPQQLETEVYLPDKLGSLQVEMLSATRRHGLLAYELDPQLNALVTEIAAGRPAIVLQNLGLSWYPVWHYAVAIGYDIDRAELILRSGPERHQALPMKTFERTWARSHYWAMLALPAGEMPAHIDEERYIAAALAMEQTKTSDQKTQLAAANLAYKAAVKRWPNNLNASMGAGNTAYALGNFAAAETAFRHATLMHPESGAAFNNLADTLAQQKKFKQALAAAQRAVQIGGAQSEVFLQTQKEIEAKLKAQQRPLKSPPKKAKTKSTAK
jgi:tetratricopeptide (TPR) repeat protein